ncbi:MAG: UDP-N-acetylmuramate dehydrogenase [Alkaliphilus sp.]
MISLNTTKHRDFFLEFMDNNTILIDESMKKHTSIRIGGAASILLIVKSVREIQKTIKHCYDNKIPYFIMGNGSNLLVSDKGISKVVIKIANSFDDVKIEGNKITAEAGVLLSKISNIALEGELSGLEFAGGIPGTLGGAITMNAGAYGGEMKDVVVSCKVMDEFANIFELTNQELQMAYRTSVIQKKNLIVLEVTMQLESSDYDLIKALTDDINLKRTTKQPLSLPSAGSIFKRPPGLYAGKLIQDSGLRGYKIGGAQVSELHCGFIVNRGGATSKDVSDLILHIQSTVREKYEVELNTEIKMIGG